MNFDIGGWSEVMQVRACVGAPFLMTWLVLCLYDDILKLHSDVLTEFVSVLSNISNLQIELSLGVEIAILSFQVRYGTNNSTYLNSIMDIFLEQEDWRFRFPG